MYLMNMSSSYQAYIPLIFNPLINLGKLKILFSFIWLSQANAADDQALLITHEWI